MRASRGFTLLEMMVAMLLASIGSFAIFSMMTGQIQAHYDQTRVGDAQANARMAMDFMSERAEGASFGIPMEFTFNSANEIDNSPGGDAAKTCPGTDVFEVRARDPRDTWLVKANTTTQLTLDATPPAGLAVGTGYALEPGVTDIAWPLGQHVMVFLGTGKVALLHTSALRTVGALTVALDPLKPYSLNFGAQPPALPDPMPSAVGDECNMVTISRFRVSCVDPVHPTLVLESDTDVNSDGVVDQNDLLPVANDIEDLQVVYFIDRDANNAIDATEQAAPVAANAISTNPLVVPNWSQVKGVRLSVIARSPNQGAPGKTVPSVPLPLENHVPAATTDLYFRRLMQDVVIFGNRNPAKPAYQHMSNRYL